VAVSAFGLVLLWLAHRQFWLLAGAFSGFLLVGRWRPPGCTRQPRAGAGRQPSLATALAAWHPNDHRLVAVRAAAGAAGTGWVLTSASLITAFAPHPVRSPLDFLRLVVLDSQSLAVRGLADARRRAGRAGLRVQRGGHSAAAGAAHRPAGPRC
jgi:hypothetical protein